MEQRQLLSADIALETILKGAGTSFSKAEYKLSDGKHSLEFDIFNAQPGGYDAYVGTTLLGRITVPASRLAQFEFTNQANDPGEAPFPAGLTLPLTAGRQQQQQQPGPHVPSPGHR